MFIVPPLFPHVRIDLVLIGYRFVKRRVFNPRSHQVAQVPLFLQTETRHSISRHSGGAQHELLTIAAANAYLTVCAGLCKDSLKVLLRLRFTENGHGEIVPVSMDFVAAKEASNR